VNLALLLPGALAALAALALPLLIHLARRDTPQRIDFAALRWLRAQARPRRRLRLEDRALLASRLALLALLALWLAQPALFGHGDTRAYVAVMPGVANAELTAQSLPTDARRHWLAEDFPALDQPRPASPQPIASLLRQLDAELDPAAPLIVLATPAFDGADAQLPRLARALDWRIVRAAEPAPQPAEASAPPRLHVVADAAHARAARYLHTAAAVWIEDAPAPIAAPDAPLPPQQDHAVAWLVAGALPEALRQWIARGGSALLAHDATAPDELALAPLWRDSQGAALVEGAALGRGRLMRLTRALTPAEFPGLFDPDFPGQLQRWLAAPADESTRADAAHWHPRSDAAAWPERPRALGPWLALLIALCFALERWLAARPPRSLA